MAANLTQRDLTFIAVAFQCMNEKPSIDYAKFATLTNLKNAKSARDSFGPVLKRLQAARPKDGDANGDGDSVETTPRTGMKSSGRKRKADDDAGDSPKKTPRGRKTKVKAEAVDEAEDEAAEAEEGPEVTPDDAAIAATIKNEDGEDEHDVVDED